MVALYAVATVLGVIAIITWVALGMVAEAVAGKEPLDPEARFGVVGRSAIAGVTGFGLGGMSASYAGSGTLVAFLGAVIGAAAMVALGRYLGVTDDPDGESA